MACQGRGESYEEKVSSHVDKNGEIKLSHPSGNGRNSKSKVRRGNNKKRQGRNRGNWRNGRIKDSLQEEKKDICLLEWAERGK